MEGENVQELDDAYSTVVNMDYFPITINQLPIVNGLSWSPYKLLDYIRKNINSFVDTSYADFSPFHWSDIDDAPLWYSDNPLGAIVNIDIKGPENGSVIVSGYKNDKWTFTTIYEPVYGEHPVSGNRDFGFLYNGDGSYTFYTRGVDRLTDFMVTKAQEYANIPFGQADKLWTSFQNKINSFTNSHQGVSLVSTPKIQRTDWQKVKDVINGIRPLNT